MSLFGHFSPLVVLAACLGCASGQAADSYASLGEPLTADCGGALARQEIEACLMVRLEAVDETLGRTEHRVRAELPPAVRPEFDRAAAAWREYRERECNTRYSSYGGGREARIALLGCQLELASARVAFLARLYN